MIERLRRHATVVWLATALLVLLGLESARVMPSGIYPEVEFPRIVVVARTGGAPPEAFSTSVTRPLEQQLVTVLGVQRVRSRTIRGAVEISLQFEADTDMWRALQLVESRVNDTRNELPLATEIVVERVTTGSFPVVTFNVAGHTDPRELRELAEFLIRPALGNVPGVGRIEVLGGDVREVEILLDPESLASLHLSPADVAAKLRSSMGLSAVGRVLEGRQALAVLGDARPKTLDDIRAIPIVSTAQGAVVSLGSVAEVVEGAADRTVRIGGPRGETVGISVARLPGASTPDVVHGAMEAVDALRPSLPAGVHVDAVYDQAALVTESMASVRDAILLGILLCAAVIGLFLRDPRAGVLAAVSVPITLATSFVFMRWFHQTLNLMSLGGMAVSVGLVVDDAIVMVEAIALRRDLGDDPVAAASNGTRELAPAVVGTTLTTVVVFVPLAFLSGVIGEFFRALAFTLTTAVLVSLAVALVLVPVGASRALTAGAQTKAARLDAAYGRILDRTLGLAWLAPIALVAILAAGALVAPHLERGFLPTMDEGAFVLDYFLPAGTSLESTEAHARSIEEQLRATPEVLTFTRRTGAELGPAAATQAYRGDIMVRLKPRSERARSIDEVIADVRERTRRSVPEARVEFVQVLQDVLDDLAGNPRPVEVKIFGPDYDTLHAIARDIAFRAEHVPGVVDLYDGKELPVPELRFAIDRDASARFGVTPEDLQTEIETALRGQVVGAVQRFDRLVGVRTRYPNPVRYDRARVLDMPFARGEHVSTFRAVADIRTTASEASLLREGLQPMVAVTLDHEGRDLGSVADSVDAIAKHTPLPPGYRVVLGGQAAAERATLRQLLRVTAVAVLLVLVVLAAQFRRLPTAVLVLGTIPVAVLGALLTLWITRTPLNASSLMGSVLLVGLVVKNGVLLLEDAERRAAAGVAPRDAVRAAGMRRVRPIVMTTLATLAGLAPLALGIGAGAELQRPLALAVIGGLVTSTLATLVLLPPAAVVLLGRRKEKLRAA